MRLENERYSSWGQKTVKTTILSGKRDRQMHEGLHFPLFSLGGVGRGPALTLNVDLLFNTQAKATIPCDCSTRLSGNNLLRLVKFNVAIASIF